MGSITISVFEKNTEYCSTVLDISIFSKLYTAISKTTQVSRSIQTIGQQIIDSCTESEKKLFDRQQ